MPNLLEDTKPIEIFISGSERRAIKCPFCLCLFLLREQALVDLIREWRKVKREYDEFKVRVNSLPEAIRRCSDAYNDDEELRARRRQQEAKATGALPEAAAVMATWMSDGSQWPCTWLTSVPDHSRGDLACIIQVIDCSI